MKHIIYILITITLISSCVTEENYKYWSFFFDGVPDPTINENIVINVTHIGDGNFNLFLYDKRPTESFINIDNSLNPDIFDVAINYSLEDNPYINYTASESKIYYIELILIENGPDTFFFYCNNDELTRYYLPIIPGYQISSIILTLILTSSLIILIKKKTMKKH